MKNIFYLLQTILIAYILAFLFLITPFAVNQAQAGSVSTLPTNSFAMNANANLIYSVVNGLTKLDKNVSADYRTTYLFTDTTPIIIAHYTPYAQEGQIAVIWVHRFPNQNAYNKWLSTVQSAGQWGNPAQGYKWYSAPVQNQNALPYQVAMYHLITPQELFKMGSYAFPSSNTQASNYGKVFGSNYNYNAVAYCSANNTGGMPCSDNAYKTGWDGFTQIVAEVAREYHTQNGVIVYDQQTTHTVTEKDSGFFKTTVTVKVYLDTTPVFYQIVPNNTPGLTAMTSNYGFIAKASSTDGGIGILRVQQGLGEWGYNFSGASQLVYEDSESGWNTWVGIALGGLMMLAGFAMPVIGPYLGTALIAGGAAYAGLSTVELIAGNQQFYNINYYNLGDMVANSNEVTRAVIQNACFWWGNTGMGGQPGSGNQYILNQFATTQPIQYSGMTVGAYQPSANDKQILQQQ